MPEEPVKTPTPVADAMRGKEPGDVRDDNGLKMKFVWCPPGKFTMENGVRRLSAPYRRRRGC